MGGIWANGTIGTLPANSSVVFTVNTTVRELGAPIAIPVNKGWMLALLGLLLAGGGGWAVCRRTAA